MRTLHRLTIALLALGFAGAPAMPAAAEPTPSPSAPPCKAGELKVTASGDPVVVAWAADTAVMKSGQLSNATGYYFKDLALTFAIWPDQGVSGLAPKVRLNTGSTKQDLHFSHVSSPRPMWIASGLKPPVVWPTGTPSGFQFEVSFPAGSTVTTYSTRLTATAAVCGDTVLASSTAMRFGFMTAGTPTQTASAKPRASASAKASRKPTPTPQASEEEVVAPGDQAPDATESADGIAPDQDLSSGESSSSPLPWIAGLGVTALIVAGGLLWWVRRSSYDED